MAHASPVATPSGAAPHLLTNINAWWRALPASQRRSYCAIVTGFISVVLLIGTFPFAAHTWVARLSQPVIALWGWGASLFLLGTLSTCGMIIRDGFAGMATVRRGVIISLLVALALCLGASRLWLGAPWGGLVGGAIARLLLRLPAPLAHLCLWGGLALDGLVLWHMTRHHRHRPGAASSRRVSHVPATGQSVPVAAMSAPVASATPSQPASAQRSALLAALPPLAGHALPNLFAPAPGRATDEDWLDALRVPAYLRRGVPLSPLYNKPPDPFALPPLPVALPEAPTVIVPGVPKLNRVARAASSSPPTERLRAIERQARRG